jgi:hypothetical protein
MSATLVNGDGLLTPEEITSVIAGGCDAGAREAAHKVGAVHVTFSWLIACKRLVTPTLEPMSWKPGFKVWVFKRNVYRYDADAWDLVTALFDDVDLDHDGRICFMAGLYDILRETV